MPNARRRDTSVPGDIETALDAVRNLLSAGANPLAKGTAAEVHGCITLDIAASKGHFKVVHGLLQRFGIEGCGGECGGVDALGTAASDEDLASMAMLTDAGVVDTGKALMGAAGAVREASVEFLLQQRGNSSGVLGYVNSAVYKPVYRNIEVSYPPGRAPVDFSQPAENKADLRSFHDAWRDVAISGATGSETPDAVGGLVQVFGDALTTTGACCGENRQQRRPRGPLNGLHLAAFDDSTKRTIELLSRGSIDVNQLNEGGWTPLIVAAMRGSSRVARILLDRGADVSITEDRGNTALHLCSANGHLSVAVDLMKAGADLEVKASDGWTPLHLAARGGYSEVTAALIEAGACVDCRIPTGATPLYLAAWKGHWDTVRNLLHAGANPLAMDTIDRDAPIPLDVAAGKGHSEVVHELLQQVGIKGCGGDSGGVDALCAAAVKAQHLGIMAMLTNAGVVDTGKALMGAVGGVREASVKFLLQQRRTTSGLLGYANSAVYMPLYFSIEVFPTAEGLPLLISPRVVRLLLDAGADTTLPLRFPGNRRVREFNGTPLALVDRDIREKKVGGLDATKEQMDRLEAVRRLLLRVEAVHAVSWLWGSPAAALVGGNLQRKSRTDAASTPLGRMLPILRRRAGRRRVLLAALFRYSGTP
eukprot:g11354.t1